ncbi:MAG: 2'-5' RNA ligase family protein [Steroidobacteraceae bacterium]
MNGERPAPRGLPTQGGLRTRRLFFALVPGGAARASLQALARQHAPRRARLVGAADLHLTLVFLGAVGEELPRLRAAAAQLRGAPCTVRLERRSGGAAACCARRVRSRRRCRRCMRGWWGLRASSGSRWMRGRCVRT